MTPDDLSEKRRRWRECEATYRNRIIMKLDVDVSEDGSVASVAAALLAAEAEAPADCPCEGESDDPGPHIEGCAFIAAVTNDPSEECPFGDEDGEYCEHAKLIGDCSSCSLYNAAVHAQQAAAKYLAETRRGVVDHPWVNEYGFFAHVDGVMSEIGSAAEAAPFAGLTTAAVNAASPRAPDASADRKALDQALAENNWPTASKAAERLGFVLCDHGKDRAKCSDCQATPRAPDAPRVQAVPFHGEDPTIMGPVDWQRAPDAPIEVKAEGSIAMGLRQGELPAPNFEESTPNAPKRVSYEVVFTNGSVAIFESEVNKDDFIASLSVAQVARVIEHPRPATLEEQLDDARAEVERLRAERLESAERRAVCERELHQAIAHQKTRAEKAESSLAAALTDIEREKKRADDAARVASETMIDAANAHVRLSQELDAAIQERDRALRFEVTEEQRERAVTEVRLILQRGGAHSASDIITDVLAALRGKGGV